MYHFFDLLSEDNNIIFAHMSEREILELKQFLVILLQRCEYINVTIHNHDRLMNFVRLPLQLEKMVRRIFQEIYACAMRSVKRFERLCELLAPAGEMWALENLRFHGSHPQALGYELSIPRLTNLPTTDVWPN